ncbi:MAG TPA: ethanolamine ammonia-lyase subunit EutC [Acidobacteriaceae bacterium]|nr:ethanolamine ammonia-lyase subunit EutC [Acidobacteriaceae bacterium]
MSGEVAKKSETAQGMGPGLDLRRFTPARVSLEQAGAAVSTREHLNFQLDHAMARDAVHARMNVVAMMQSLRARGRACIALRSAASPPGQSDRSVYLRRPDLGRKLDPRSVEALREGFMKTARGLEVAVVIADGLSALAVDRHALALLDAVDAEGLDTWAEAPVCIVSNGRVAVGDEVGLALRAELAVMLIGERPGLSSPDSLGIYLTWEPRPGRTDAERNCISNIRAEGLGYRDAARRLVYYIREARRLRTTGVVLKERSSEERAKLGGRASDADD